MLFVHFIQEEKKTLYFALLHYMYCSSNSTSQKNTKNTLNIYASLSSHSWRSTYGYVVILSCYKILLPVLLPLLCKLVSSLQYISILKKLFPIFRFPFPFLFTWVDAAIQPQRFHGKIHSLTLVNITCKALFLIRITYGIHHLFHYMYICS